MRAASGCAVSRALQRLSPRAAALEGALRNDLGIGSTLGARNPPDSRDCEGRSRRIMMLEPASRGVLWTKWEFFERRLVSRARTSAAVLPSFRRRWTTQVATSPGLADPC